MKNILSVIILIIVLVFAQAGKAYSAEEGIVPPITIKKVKTEAVNDKLKFTITYNSDVSKLVHQFVYYYIKGEFHKNKKRVQPDNDVSLTPTKVEFAIPISEISGNNAIIYNVEGSNAAGTILYQLPKVDMDISWLDNLLITAQQLEETKRKLQKSEEQVNEKDKVIQGLQVDISPRKINIDGEPWVTDNRAVVKVKLDVPCQISATLNGNGYNKTYNSKARDINHVVIFDGLSSQQDYNLDIVALLPGTNNPSNARVNKQLIHTSNAMSTPSAEIKYKASHNKIDVIVKPDQNIYVSVIAKEKLFPDKAVFGPPKRIVDFHTNTDIAPSGDQVLSNNVETTIQIPDLLPNRTYSIEVNGINNQGKEFISKFVTEQTTVSVPVALDFGDDYIIDMSRIGIKVKFKSTIVAKVVKLKVDVGPSTVLERSMIPTSNDIEATIGLDGVKTILETTTGLPTMLPRLTITIEKDNEYKSKNFQLAFRLPNKDEVAKSSLSQDDKDILSSAYDEVKNGGGWTGNIKWAKLVKAGIPLILSAF